MFSEQGLANLIKKRHGIKDESDFRFGKIKNTINKYNSTNNFDEFSKNFFNEDIINPYSIKDLLFNDDGSKKWNSSGEYVNEEKKEQDRKNEYENKRLQGLKTQEEEARLRSKIASDEWYEKLTEAQKKEYEENNHLVGPGGFHHGGSIFKSRRKTKKRKTKKRKTKKRKTIRKRR
jgi:hypothetical protein